MLTLVELYWHEDISIPENCSVLFHWGPFTSLHLVNWNVWLIEIRWEIINIEKWLKQWIVWVAKAALLPPKHPVYKVNRESIGTVRLVAFSLVLYQGKGFFEKKVWKAIKACFNYRSMLIISRLFLIYIEFVTLILVASVATLILVNKIWPWLLVAACATLNFGQHYVPNSNEP